MDTTTNMTSSSQAIALPDMDFENIRKTDEARPRVSVLDLITVVSKVNNPREAWAGLQRTHLEVVSHTDNYNSDFKFPGRRQRGTPVIDATGAIMIINLLPGAIAASFRASKLYKDLKDYLNTRANMASLQKSKTIALPNMNFEKIRKTNEKPYRVSVIDLIGAVTKNNNPSDDWKKLRTSHPEVIADSYDYDSDYKFPGRRQRETPVINAEGAILIINLLPGSMAASFRAAWANIIVRYIGGDMTLKAEVERNNALQKELHEDDPRAFCRQHVEYRGLKSVTGVQDIRSAQLYFGSAGPPENWLDVRRQDGSPYVLKQGEHIIKVGCHDHNTGRHGEHVREFKGFGVSDSILDENPSRLERGMKDHLRNANTLLSARHVNKTTRDTELFAANLETYEAYVNKAIELAQKREQSVNMEYERELTKRMEHETKRLESSEETKRAEIHANLEVQKMQMRLEMLRLEKSSTAVLQAFPPTSPAPKTSPQGEHNTYEEYVDQRLVTTDNGLDRLAWNRIITDCQHWMRRHPVHADMKIDKHEIAKLKRAVIDRLGRKDTTQGDLVHKSPGNRDPPKFKGWSGLRFAH